MENENIRLSELLTLHLKGEVTELEQAELWDYVNDPVYAVQIKKLLGVAFEQINPVALSEVMQHNVLQNIYSITANGERKVAVRKLKIWQRVAVAASIVLVASLGLYFYTSNPTSHNLQQATDIAPGKNGATLTLANGEKILINDALAGNIATQSGVKISKTADGQIIYVIQNEREGANESVQYNTLSTTRGEQTQVRLPDGTLVFLNAESSLKYPTSFARSAKRQISLTGEGYFEVAKDKVHPFIVNSKGQKVEVLGTHFNINSYDNEPLVRTTLLEGSVKINNKILKPNEQSILADGKIEIQQVDVDNVVAWKNGSFLFEDEPLSSIMRKIERWYDVEIVYDNNIDKNELYGGGVSRYDNVSKVLEKLTLTGGIHFKIEGRRITVMK